MKTVQNIVFAVCSAALFALSSGACAGPVSFNITAAQFLPGTGYGIDASESSGNLLDVRFSTNAFAAQNRTLDTVNQSFTFTFGAIDMEEPAADSGIVSGELDGLDITAKLSFTAPTGVTQTIDALGIATPGTFSDLQVHYAIDWLPVTILFGNGGSFQLSLTDMAFDRQGTQFQTATVKLLSLPDEGLPVSDVPEPATAALLAIGVSCFAVFRRRRAKV